MRYRYALALFFIFLAVLPSCGNNRHIAGEYRSANPSGEVTQALLTLKDDGKGSWTVGREEVPFTWELYRDEVRFHYRSGGVVSGKIEGNAIDITLPGVGKIRFQRVAG